MRLLYASLVAMLVLAGAAVACSDSKKSDAKLADEALQTALQAHSSGNLNEAFGGYLEVLKHDPTNKFAYYDMGLIEDTRGNLKLGEAYYRVALANDPNYVVALFNLAIVRTKLNDLPEAIELYRRAISLKPDYAFAHLNLGIQLRNTGQTAEGDAEIAQALKLDPGLAPNAPPAEGSGASGAPTPRTARP